MLHLTFYQFIQLDQGMIRVVHQTLKWSSLLTFPGSVSAGSAAAAAAGMPTAIGTPPSLTQFPYIPPTIYPRLWTHTAEDTGHSTAQGESSSRHSPPQNKEKAVHSHASSVQTRMSPCEVRHKLGLFWGTQHCSITVLLLHRDPGQRGGWGSQQKPHEQKRSHKTATLNSVCFKKPSLFIFSSLFYLSLPFYS